MKPELAASLAAAVLFHALILFGFRMETPARPLAMSDEPSTEDVSLVQAPPAPAPPAEPLSTPEPTPESTPEPTPVEPQPTPEATPPPDMPTPPPTTTPDEESIPTSTPEVKHTKAIPHHKRTAVPHSAPGTAASLAGTTGHGAAGGSSGVRYLSNPRPDYPAEAKEMRQQGVVYLNVLVGADGHASDVSVKRSSGFPLLDHAAVEAVRRWIFEPARVGGLPVASPQTIPVRFVLED